jgi:hypothetical protein
MEGDVTDDEVATSNGDVHIRTGDGIYYDFQLVGEFIALKSKTGDFELQARQAPWRETSRTISTNIAVAMNVNGDRVGVYLRRNTILFVNGAATPLSNQRISLPKGGEIDSNGNEIYIRWPDQSRVKVVLLGDYLNFTIDLSKLRAGTMSGLFGNFDGNILDDLTNRVGQRIAIWDSQKSGPAKVDVPGQLYRLFGDSWRVHQSESLFDYDPGQSTATWTDRNFPYRITAIADSDAGIRRSAEDSCRAAGVTDPRLFANCVLDVAETGEKSFATSAAGIQSDVKLVVGFRCQQMGTGGSQCTEYAPQLPGSRIGTVLQIRVETAAGDSKSVETFNCSRIDTLHRASCKFITKGSVFDGSTTVTRYALDTGIMHEENGVMRRH